MTPAAPIGVLATVGHKVKDGVSFVLGAGKTLWQNFKGEKKLDDSKSFIAKAKGGDKNAV